MTSPYMSVLDAAQYLRLSVATIYRHMDAGTLESVKFGGRRLIKRASVQKALGEEIA